MIVWFVIITLLFLLFLLLLFLGYCNVILWKHYYVFRTFVTQYTNFGWFGLNKTDNPALYVAVSACTRACTHTHTKTLLTTMYLLLLLPPLFLSFSSPCLQEHFYKTTHVRVQLWETGSLAHCSLVSDL